MALESLCGVKQTPFSRGAFQEDDVNLEKALMMSSSFQVPISVNVSFWYFYSALQAVPFNFNSIRLQKIIKIIYKAFSKKNLFEFNLFSTAFSGRARNSESGHQL